MLTKAASYALAASILVLLLVGVAHAFLPLDASPAGVASLESLKEVYLYAGSGVLLSGVAWVLAATKTND